jgi:hypothetical protein
MEGKAENMTKDDEEFKVEGTFTRNVSLKLVKSIFKQAYFFDPKQR